MLERLQRMPCRIVLAETENRRVDSFAEYDLGISFLYTHRISASETADGRKWVNFHPGPLPEFRGRNLAYQAIMQGAARFGATLHYMDPQFDTGDLIEVRRFPIELHHTAGDLMEKSHQLLEGLFEEYIPRLLTGPVPATPQTNGRYFPKNPIKNAVELTARQMQEIRALTVYPKFCATAQIGGRTFKIVPVSDGPSEAPRLLRGCL